MTKYPFPLVASSWQAGLVAGLTAEFRVFDATQYQPGDVSVSRGVLGDIVGPEFALRLNSARRPAALEVALSDLLGQNFDTTHFGSIFVIPNEQREVIELASPLQIALAADAVASLQSNEPTSVFVRARRVAESRGAELILDENRRGDSTVRVERTLSLSDLDYTVTYSDQSSFRYPNKQLDDFARTIQEVAIALKPDGPPPTSAGACYIATAVYGSYDAPQVLSLRRFRDHQLATSLLGRATIRMYYAMSPRFAKRLEGASTVNSAAKVLLDALVHAVQKYER